MLEINARSLNLPVYGILLQPEETKTVMFAQMCSSYNEQFQLNCIKLMDCSNTQNQKNHNIIIRINQLFQCLLIHR